MTLRIVNKLLSKNSKIHFPATSLLFHTAKRNDIVETNKMFTASPPAVVAGPTATFCTNKIERPDVINGHFSSFAEVFGNPLNHYLVMVEGKSLFRRVIQNENDADDLKKSGSDGEEGGVEDDRQRYRACVFNATELRDLLKKYDAAVFGGGEQWEEGTCRDDGPIKTLILLGKDVDVDGAADPNKNGDEDQKIIWAIDLALPTSLTATSPPSDQPQSSPKPKRSSPPAGIPTGDSNLIFMGLLDAYTSLEPQRALVDGSRLSTARGLAQWHSVTRFCSRCGAAMRAQRMGTARKCSNADCKAQVFPRQDPAVITCVESYCGRYTLLGRKKVSPLGRYTVVAGFIDMGEAAEDTVIREVLEETGVLADRSTVQFVASHPWLFPQSFMMGFKCTTAARPVSGEAGPRDASEIAQHAVFETVASIDYERLALLPPASPFSEAFTKATNDTKAITAAAENSATAALANYDGLPLITKGGWVKNIRNANGSTEKEEDGGWSFLPAANPPPHELEDARWFRKDLVASLLARSAAVNLPTAQTLKPPHLHLPWEYAIANLLLADWVMAGSVGGGSSKL